MRNEFLYNIVTHTPSLLEKMPKLIVQKKVLILTTFHSSHEKSLKEMIENKFSGNVLVSLYYSEGLQLDIEYLENFDVILTNYELGSKELESKIVYADVGASTELLGKVEETLKAV